MKARTQASAAAGLIMAILLQLVASPSAGASSIAPAAPAPSAAVPASQVLRLVAAAASIKTLPSDLVPSLKDLAAENEWSMVAEYNAADQQAAKQAGVQYIDPFPWFCSSVCTAVIGNMAVYAKANHISLEYATFLSGALQEALRPAMSSEGR